MTHAAGLSSSFTLMNARPCRGQAAIRKPAATLPNARANVAGDAHHLAGRAHLRARAWCRRRGTSRTGTPTLSPRRASGTDHVGRRRARRASCRPSPWRRSSRAGAPSPSRRRARCATRAGSPRGRRPGRPCTANCTFISPTTPSSSASWRVCSSIEATIDAGKRVRRQHARRVARVNAGLLDVLHDAADDGLLAVAHAVDVDLDGVLQELVDEDASACRPRAPLRPRAPRTPRARRRCGRSSSRARRARTTGARAPGSRSRLATRNASSTPRAMPPRGRLRPSLVSSSSKRSRSSARSMASALVPSSLHARARERHRELQRRLPAELHDDAVERALLALFFADGEHVFERERLEVEAVRGVVVGRHRLGVAVDHDGLEAQLAQREHGVHAAVVELDALPDAVRPAAEDDHLAAIGRRALALASRTSSRGTACARRTRRRRCRRGGTRA